MKEGREARFVLIAVVMLGRNAIKGLNMHYYRGAVISQRSWIWVTKKIIQKVGILFEVIEEFQRGGKREK